MEGSVMLAMQSGKATGKTLVLMVGYVDWEARKKERRGETESRR